MAHDRRAARRGDDGRRPPGPGDGQGDPTVIGARERAHLTPSGDLLPGPGGPRDITIRPYTQHWRWPLPRRDERLIDPLNLLLLGTSPGEAMAALGAQGWRRPDDGAVHVLWIGHRRRRMSDHTALGTRAARVHVRLWAVPAGTVAAAHDETLAGERHVVRSWDGARAAVAEALAAAGWRALEPSPEITKPGLRGVPSDGRAWRLAA